LIDKGKVAVARRLPYLFRPDAFASLTSRIAMNQTTTMTQPIAVRTTLRATRSTAPAEPPRSLLVRWLASLCANTTETEHRMLLDFAVDHSDLEWRTLDLGRRLGRSGLSVGGSRF
jgi:hypothetical protein